MTGDDTIYALSSGAGRSGVAVIRLSGSGCAGVVERMAGALPQPRRATLRSLRDGDGAVLDKGLVLWFPSPGSFTGEDMAEFHMHGSRACVASVLAALGAHPGLRPAQAGEFTRRAFDNGRLDLTQVEGLADLIDAETEAQRRQALRRMDGEAGRALEDWRHRLMRCLAYVEAEIDFVEEEDVAVDLSAAIRPELEVLAQEIDAEIVQGNRGELVRDGVHVAIAGAPNVGKSSLLNALARRDVAIVSDVAGTTRDVLEVRLDLGGYPVILADTAGLRDTQDAVEREGVDRALRRAIEADVVLLILDAREQDASGETEIDSRTIRVWNKADLVRKVPGDSDRDVWISAKTGLGLDRLIAALSQRAAILLAGGESALITRERHRLGLVACRDAIARALGTFEAGTELAAEDLRIATRELGRLTGRVDVEDLLDVIFSDFCIGK